jgi:hypothetical protein
MAYSASLLADNGPGSALPRPHSTYSYDPSRRRTQWYEIRAEFAVVLLLATIAAALLLATIMPT